MDAKRTNRKIPILWTALVAWCLIFFASARFLFVLPVSALVVVALINYGVLAGFIFALREAYRERKLTDSSGHSRASNRRIFLLWIGLITYCLIILNSPRLLKSSPIPVIVGGALINFALVSSIAIALRKAYRDRKSLRAQT
jgi:hypothetical protein